MMVLNPEQYRLCETEHQKIFEDEIKPELFEEAKPTEKPVAVIFGGQPGAGKSASITAACSELEQHGGSVKILGDELRDYHPQYQNLIEKDDKTAAFYTDRDSGRWVEKSIEEAKIRRVNVVIEGTMRNSDVVAATMNTFRAAGYEVDARAMAVNFKLSEQGILQRYENQRADRGQGRMTTPESHQAAYDGMLSTLGRIESEKLADRLTIYRRGNEAIYTNELKDGQWVKEPQARTVLEEERGRSMTLRERREYAQGHDRLAEQIAKPERKASAEEIRKIEALRQRAQAELLHPEDAAKKV